MRISDWSSDVCSSDLLLIVHRKLITVDRLEQVRNLAERFEHRLLICGRRGAGSAHCFPLFSLQRAAVKDRSSQSGENIEAAERAAQNIAEIGRATCRERECQYE